jgi:2-polyprenyl-3-methyl-5-hydroxy-6-metoxy-1,4-benzoquinol methylase
MIGDVRTQLKQYLGRINVNNITIIDWCSGTKPIYNSIAHNNTCKIITVDNRAHRRPSIVADVCKPITIEQADMAFCMESLEHLIDPDIALDNIYNNLKGDGYLYISVPFVCPIHDRYGDYWRWTASGIKTLLEKHGFKVLETVEFKFKSEVEDRVGYLLKALK